MRRYFRYTFFALAGITLVFIGSAWYLLHDEAFLKARLSSLSLKYTGRQLTVDGPLSLSPGRVTTLEASKITFSNADWATQADMATAGHLRISFDLQSLFKDQLVFPELDIRECQVQLLKGEDDKANWDMIKRKKSSPDTRPKNDFPVRLNSLLIENCSLLLTTPDLKVPLDITARKLSMKHHGDNRWEGQGSGSINKETLTFDGWLNPFNAFFDGGPMSHEVTLELGQISAKSSGSVQNAKTWAGANITAKIKGPEITKILNEFNLPLFSEGAFDYQLKLNTEGQMTRIDLDGDLGTVDITANGELDQLKHPKSGNIQFAVDGPNLGALAKLFGIDGVVEKPFSHELQSNFEEGGIHITKATVKTDTDQLEISGHFNNENGYAGTALEVHFHSDDMGVWTTVLGQPQQNIGPIELNGTLSSDAAGLFSVKATAIQGETHLDVQGPLGRFPQPIAPELDVVFSSPNASPLAAIADWKKFPAAPLSVNGKIGYKNKQVQLGKVRVNLAGDLADFNGVMGVGDRFSGSNATVRFDVKNVAALGRLFGRDGLPDQPLKLDVQVKPADKGLAFQVTDGNLGQIQLDLDGRIPDLQKPLAMDGNFDISLPRLSDVSFLAPNVTLPDAPFSAKGKIERSGQRVLIDEVDLNLAGNHAHVDGVLNLQNRYAGSDFNIKIDISNAGEVGRMFGQDGIPDQPVKLEAHLKPDGKGMKFSVSDGNLGDLQVEAEGKFADLSELMAVDAQFDINLPRLSDFSFLFPNRELPDVPFMASGRLQNQQSKTHLEDVQITIGKVKASIDGDLLPGDRFELTIKADGADASGPAKVLGQTLKPEDFSLSTQLSGDPSEFALDDLELALGDSSATGALKISLGDEKTINGKIDSPYFDISQFQADEEAKESGEKKPKRQWMFDDRPVMHIADLGYGLDLDVTVDVLVLENTRLKELSLGLLISQNLIELHPFSLKGSMGGTFNGEMRLDDRGATPVFHLNMHGSDTRIGLTAAPGQDPSTIPPMELDLLVDGTGQTRREMASSLDGKLRIYLGSGLVAESGMELFFNDFLTNLFNILNPFAKTTKYTKLECAVVAADAVSGLVTVFPIIYNTEQLTILSQGKIDLNTEKINLSFNTKPRKGLGLSAGALINPLIKVGGTLAAPAITLDAAGTVASTGLAVVTAGISVLAKSMSDRFLSSSDPCGDARKEIAKQDSKTD